MGVIAMELRQNPITQSGMHDRLANPRQPACFQGESAWLILVVAIGSIVGGLMLLRDTANKVELTEEQRKRVAERNAEMDAKEAQDR